MSPEAADQRRAAILAKHARMANQIATFFASKPREEGIAGVAEHINKFWEPRMRRHLFEIVDGGGEGLHELVLAAAASIRRPVDEPRPAAAAGGAPATAGA
ncbi:MAG TPA: formate dehydrogenase subunit delta [Rhizobiales bacterium]|nr:formate dehydrogenase subunit delta [Hyphomicrobiales bacterium]